jgi:hypothetical protein
MAPNSKAARSGTLSIIMTKTQFAATATIPNIVLSEFDAEYTLKFETI